MRIYVVAIIMMVLFTGIFHMLFIMFDYGFHNPDSGAMTQLGEKFNETLSPSMASSRYNNTKMLRQSFGISRFICIGSIPVICVVAILRRQRVVVDE